MAATTAGKGIIYWSLCTSSQACDNNPQVLYFVKENFYFVFINSQRFNQFVSESSILFHTLCDNNLHELIKKENFELLFSKFMI